MGVVTIMGVEKGCGLLTWSTTTSCQSLYHIYVSIAKSLISSNLALTVNDVGKP